MYVRGEDLERWMQGSLEANIDRVERALAEHAGVAVEVLATREDGALYRTPEGALHEAAFTQGPTGIEGVTSKPSAIPVFGAEAAPVLAAAELRAITAGMLEGQAPERTRVRNLTGVLRAGEPYTMGAVIGAVEEAMSVAGEQHWYALYEANQERIRTAMWGQIRELEARVPSTAYGRLPRTRLVEFEPELRESLGLLAGVCNQIVDTIRPLEFDRDHEFLGAIRESLIAEAERLHGLLARAGQLMRAEDMDRAAVAHDRWCGRAKTMEVVAAYLTGRSKKGAEASK